MKKMLALAIVYSLTGVMQPAHIASAASFNCAANGLAKTEQAICGDPSLSALDSRLGSVYALARNNASDADKTVLVAAQKAWVSRRNQCADTQCLADAYNSRIAELAPSPSGTFTAQAMGNGGASDNAGASKQNAPATPADISALAAEQEAGASAARKLISQQIGFKDFRIGRVITAKGDIPGLEGCSPMIQLPKPSADMVNVDHALHARWDVVLGGAVACHVATTVLEKTVSVEIDLYGNPQTIGGIQLMVDSADLQTLSDLLSKTLGPPQDKTITITADQARAEIQKAEMQQCDEVGESFRNSSTAASLEVARCHQQVPGRVLMRMGQVPVDGIIQRTRFWSPEGVLVGYQTTNIGDHSKTQITFNSRQTLASYQKIFGAISKDTEDQKTLAGKAELAAKSKDF
jgi:uncharacterized protein